ncbi:hypothetical protein [Methylobacterium sp. B1]|uniref:hypothetical protein n=1 Tax=Methylobacterium sp. B1 TaxID=91459 RepID=UPI0011D20EE2|nr:hypothetical protein [Methylobacterium sp. B1]
MFEAWSPQAGAVITLMLLLVFQSRIVSTFVDNQLSLSQMYTAIFGWASVMTGFQFGVYGLIFSKTDGFIAKISSTKAMRDFMSYTSAAVKLGFILTLFGFPFLVMNSDMKDISNLSYWLGSMYFALFVSSFISTVRVAKLFGAMSRIKTRERLPA